MDELHALAKLVTDSVKQIEESCTARNVTFPPLNSTFSLESEAARMDPAVLQASANIVAAAAQLTAIVRPPTLTLWTTALAFHVPSALRLASETNTVEILREAGPQGLHVDKIAKKANTNANKLARALRLLATEHIFTEVSPDVFTNNRISSLLDTDKSVAELHANPEDKHVRSSCIAALISHFTIHAFKSSAYLTDSLMDPEYVDSFEVDKTAFNVAFGTDLPIWAWFEKPENKHHLQIFSLAMEGGTKLIPQDAVLKGLDWSSLPKGSKFVDVGGGVGSQSMLLARAHPHLRFVIQDREATIGQAQEFWKEKYPEALSNGTVTFQVNDFLKSQPVTDATIFFMRMIMHDWSDTHCETILKILRAAAKPDTQLLIIDLILSYACIDNGSTNLKIPGNDLPKPPAPLLPNAGRASLFDYQCDLQMMTLLNGQERTLEQFNQLLARSGWRLSRVFRNPYYTGGHQQALAVPV
ncbi:hypothetical protein M0805_009133 [Coniferiporia weirii]|nr:hypothetical protein M0805_009133 [Coniferiporia weirii]